MQLKRLAYSIINPGFIRGIGLLFNSSIEGTYHKKIIAKSHPNITKIENISFLILSSIVWHLAVFWLHLTAFFIKKINSKDNNAPSLLDLLYLGLWVGAAPKNYSALGLHNSQKKDWLKYIFIEESLTWHIVHNQRDKNNIQYHEQVKTLNDKQALQELLNKNNINTIPTLLHLTKRTEKPKATLSDFIENQINQDRDFFIKPQIANAMRGCILGLIRAKTHECNGFGYNLLKQKNQFKNKETLINAAITSLEELGEENGLLVQPLLEPFIRRPNQNKSKKILSIVRIISQQSITNNESIDMKYAFLETECSEKTSIFNWETLSINLQTGQTEDIAIQRWNEMRETIKKAHSLFGSVQSIAWDIGLYNNEIVIIEGNSGWNVIEPQYLYKKPILS